MLEKVKKVKKNCTNKVCTVDMGEVDDIVSSSRFIKNDGR